jgi:hypothetical protein
MSGGNGSNKQEEGAAIAPRLRLVFAVMTERPKRAQVCAGSHLPVRALTHAPVDGAAI